MANTVIRDVLISGYLAVKGLSIVNKQSKTITVIKKWQQLWVVLGQASTSQCVLAIYQDRAKWMNSQKPLTAYQFIQLHSFTDKQTYDGLHMFLLKFAGGHKISFACGTQKQKSEWLTAVQKALDACYNKKQQKKENRRSTIDNDWWQLSEQQESSTDYKEFQVVLKGCSLTDNINRCRVCLFPNQNCMEVYGYSTYSSYTVKWTWEYSQLYCISFDKETLTVQLYIRDQLEEICWTGNEALQLYNSLCSITGVWDCTAQKPDATGADISPTLVRLEESDYTSVGIMLPDHLVQKMKDWYLVQLVYCQRHPQLLGQYKVQLSLTHLHLKGCNCPHYWSWELHHIKSYSLDTNQYLIIEVEGSSDVWSGVFHFGSSGAHDEHITTLYELLKQLMLKLYLVVMIKQQLIVTRRQLSGLMGHNQPVHDMIESFSCELIDSPSQDLLGHYTVQIFVNRIHVICANAKWVWLLPELYGYKLDQEEVGGATYVTIQISNSASSVIEEWVWSGDHMIRFYSFLLELCQLLSQQSSQEILISQVVTIRVMTSQTVTIHTYTFQLTNDKLVLVDTDNQQVACSYPVDSIKRLNLDEHKNELIIQISHDQGPAFKPTQLVIATDNAQELMLLINKTVQNKRQSFNVKAQLMEHKLPITYQSQLDTQMPEAETAPRLVRLEASDYTSVGILLPDYLVQKMEDWYLVQLMYCQRHPQLLGQYEVQLNLTHLHLKGCNSPHSWSWELHHIKSYSLDTNQYLIIEVEGTSDVWSGVFHFGSSDAHNEHIMTLYELVKQLMLKLYLVIMIKQQLIVTRRQLSILMKHNQPIHDVIESFSCELIEGPSQDLLGHYTVQIFVNRIHVICANTKWVWLLPELYGYKLDQEEVGGATYVTIQISNSASAIEEWVWSGDHMIRFYSFLLELCQLLSQQSSQEILISQVVTIRVMTSQTVMIHTYTFRLTNDKLVLVDTDNQQVVSSYPLDCVKRLNLDEYKNELIIQINQSPGSKPTELAITTDNAQELKLLISKAVQNKQQSYNAQLVANKSSVGNYKSQVDVQPPPNDDRETIHHVSAKQISAESQEAQYQVPANIHTSPSHKSAQHLISAHQIPPDDQQVSVKTMPWYPVETDCNITDTIHITSSDNISHQRQAIPAKQETYKTHELKHQVYTMSSKEAAVSPTKAQQQVLTETHKIEHHNSSSFQQIQENIPLYETQQPPHKVVESRHKVMISAQPARPKQAQTQTQHALLKSQQVSVEEEIPLQPSVETHLLEQSLTEGENREYTSTEVQHIMHQTLVETPAPVGTPENTHPVSCLPEGGQCFMVDTLQASNETQLNTQTNSQKVTDDGIKMQISSGSQKESKSQVVFAQQAPLWQATNQMVEETHQTTDNEAMDQTQYSPTKAMETMHHPNTQETSTDTPAVVNTKQDTMKMSQMPNESTNPVLLHETRKVPHLLGEDAENPQAKIQHTPPPAMQVVPDDVCNRQNIQQTLNKDSDQPQVEHHVLTESINQPIKTCYTKPTDAEQIHTELTEHILPDTEQTIVETYPLPQNEESVEAPRVSLKDKGIKHPQDTLMETHVKEATVWDPKSTKVITHQVSENIWQQVSSETEDITIPVKSSEVNKGGQIFPMEDTTQISIETKSTEATIQGLPTLDEKVIDQIVKEISIQEQQISTGSNKMSHQLPTKTVEVMSDQPQIVHQHPAEAQLMPDEVHDDVKWWQLSHKETEQVLQPDSEPVIAQEIKKDSGQSHRHLVTTTTKTPVEFQKAKHLKQNEQKISDQLTDEMEQMMAKNVEYHTTVEQQPELNKLTQTTGVHRYPNAQATKTNEPVIVDTVQWIPSESGNTVMEFKTQKVSNLLVENVTPSQTPQAIIQDTPNNPQPALQAIPDDICNTQDMQRTLNEDLDNQPMGGHRVSTKSINQPIKTHYTRPTDAEQICPKTQELTQHILLDIKQTMVESQPLLQNEQSVEAPGVSLKDTETHVQEITIQESAEVITRQVTDNIQQQVLLETEDIIIPVRSSGDKAFSMDDDTVQVSVETKSSESIIQELPNLDEKVIGQMVKETSIEAQQISIRPNKITHQLPTETVEMVSNQPRILHQYPSETHLTSDDIEQWQLSLEESEQVLHPQVRSWSVKAQEIMEGSGQHSTVEIQKAEQHEQIPNELQEVSDCLMVKTEQMTSKNDVTVEPQLRLKHTQTTEEGAIVKSQDTSPKMQEILCKDSQCYMITTSKHLLNASPQSMDWTDTRIETHEVVSSPSLKPQQSVAVPNNEDHQETMMTEISHQFSDEVHKVVIMETHCVTSHPDTPVMSYDVTHQAGSITQTTCQTSDGQNEILYQPRFDCEQISHQNSSNTQQQIIPKGSMQSVMHSLPNKADQTMADTDQVVQEDKPQCTEVDMQCTPVKFEETPNQQVERTTEEINKLKSEIMHHEVATNVTSLSDGNVVHHSSHDQTCPITETCPIADESTLVTWEAPVDTYHKFCQPQIKFETQESTDVGVEHIIHQPAESEVTTTNIAQITFNTQESPCKTQDEVKDQKVITHPPPAVQSTTDKIYTAKCQPSPESKQTLVEQCEPQETSQRQILFEKSPRQQQTEVLFKKANKSIDDHLPMLEAQQTITVNSQQVLLESTKSTFHSLVEIEQTTNPTELTQLSIDNEGLTQQNEPQQISYQLPEGTEEHQQKPLKTECASIDTQEMVSQIPTSVSDTPQISPKVECPKIHQEASSTGSKQTLMTEIPLSVDDDTKVVAETPTRRKNVRQSFKFNMCNKPEKVTPFSVEVHELSIEGNRISCQPMAKPFPVLTGTQLDTQQTAIKKTSCLMEQSVLHEISLDYMQKTVETRKTFYGVSKSDDTHTLEQLFSIEAKRPLFEQPEPQQVPRKQEITYRVPDKPHLVSVEGEQLQKEQAMANPQPNPLQLTDNTVETREVITTVETPADKHKNQKTIYPVETTTTTIQEPADQLPEAKKNINPSLVEFNEDVMIMDFASGNQVTTDNFTMVTITPSNHVYHHYQLHADNNTIITTGEVISVCTIHCCSYYTSVKVVEKASSQKKIYNAVSTGIPQCQNDLQATRQAINELLLKYQIL